MRFYHYNKHIIHYTYLQPQLYPQLALVDVFVEATLRAKQSKQFWETDETGKMKQIKRQTSNFFHFQRFYRFFFFPRFDAWPYPRSQNCGANGHTGWGDSFSFHVVSSPFSWEKDMEQLMVSFPEIGPGLLTTSLSIDPPVRDGRGGPPQRITCLSWFGGINLWWGTMWGPPVVSRFISPSNYSNKYHKP